MPGLVHLLSQSVQVPFGGLSQSDNADHPSLEILGLMLFVNSTLSSSLLEETNMMMKRKKTKMDLGGRNVMVDGYQTDKLFP
jgi:hypothetical protein